MGQDSRYRLVVTKIDPLPAADPQEVLRRQYQNNNFDSSPATSESQLLYVELTEDEFRAIKKAVMEVM